MADQHLFFESGGLRLRGALSLPESIPLGGVVLCAPLLDEHIASYRVFYDLASQLQDLGFAVLRFDYGAHGDSEGRFQDSSLALFTGDVRRAMALLRDHAEVPSMGLIGARLGANLALEAAGSQTDLDFVAALVPIASVEKHMQGWLRRRAISDSMYNEPRRNARELVDDLRAGGPVDVGGYLLGAELFESLSSLDLAKQLQAVSAESFLAVTEAERLDSRGEDHLYTEGAFWQFPAVGTVCDPPQGLFDALESWLFRLPVHGGGGQ